MLTFFFLPQLLHRAGLIGFLACLEEICMFSIHFWQRDAWKWRMIIAVNFSNLSNWKEAWKKSGLQRDSNPWPPRYRCDATSSDMNYFIYKLHINLMHVIIYRSGIVLIALHDSYSINRLTYYDLYLHRIYRANRLWVRAKRLFVRANRLPVRAKGFRANGISGETTVNQLVSYS